MEKIYEITEKQLAYLENYIDNKYPLINKDSKIELIDHVVSDFEATTNGGNLSQYLSNEQEFVREFANGKIKLYKNLYRKQTAQYFLSFFKDYKKITFTILLFIILYYLSGNLSNYWLWLSYIISYSVFFLIIIFFSFMNQRAFKNLVEVKYLGAEIFLPLLLMQFAQGLEFKDFLMQNSFVFSLLWVLTILYSYAALIIVKKNEILILTKYKNLIS